MTLVLLSGWGIDARIWHPLAPYWPGGIEVRTPDWPGYGERSHETLPKTLPVLADKMRGDLPQDAIWVGWSLGGLLAGALLPHLPPPRALLLVGTGARFCSEDGVRAAELATFRRAFDRDPRATWQHFLRWQLQGEPAPRMAHRRLLDLLGGHPSASSQTLATGLEQLAYLDLGEMLAAPPCPIWRIAGERDRLMGKTARQSAERILTGCGHSPMLSHPETLVRHLVELAGSDADQRSDRGGVAS
ncbi:alpha/beta fold hydrolase [Halomonas sp. MCCC 1A17488]|uniref:Alpha/beta fold hydrolase n=1 Tax=Billgrantia sulfidoxydans TaxID=2733484 RepID=A0ABX7W7I9_9GAMM|nr:MULTISPECIES: alpha/beta fold hydrolase [Halomonas]MCE8014659.1 alpha/beta fold hydrolase [Halomonas sp. MCCC 1A17488]MCG3237992.1 alpha/beta fold hydrolase [Halomonas sp. MCCC 1A17488]QPP48227.1 alpha/beta fold hydrolase [Halomonas sp. SS10-MC5]QTP55527.1 alpha/beta fold hydrolase [Halomonas sulfidoxydans]